MSGSSLLLRVVSAWKTSPWMKWCVCVCVWRTQRLVSPWPDMTRQVRSEFSGGVHLGQQDDWPKPLKPEVKEQLDSRWSSWRFFGVDEVKFDVKFDCWCHYDVIKCLGFGWCHFHMLSLIWTRWVISHIFVPSQLVTCYATKDDAVRFFSQTMFTPAALIGSAALGLLFLPPAKFAFCDPQQQPYRIFQFLYRATWISKFSVGCTRP